MKPINKYLVNRHISTTDNDFIRKWTGKTITCSCHENENLFKTGDCVKISWGFNGIHRYCLAIINKEETRECPGNQEHAFLCISAFNDVCINHPVGLYANNIVSEVSDDEFKLLNEIYTYYITHKLQNKPSYIIGKIVNSEFIPN